MGKTKQASFYVLIGLLLFSGWFVNFLVARDDRYMGELRLPDFPKQVGDWQGEDEKISDGVINELHTDAILFRNYQNPATEKVWLYTSYHRSQKEGRLIHSPRHCYPGAGWEIVYNKIIELPLADGRALTLNKMLVSQGSRQQLVLYWYQSSQRVVANEFAVRFYMIKDAIFTGRTDGSLVRVSAVVKNNEVEETFALEKRFIELFYPKLLEYLPSKNIS